MSDLHSGENRRFTEMNTNELERLLREDAVRPETDPDDVEALFEAMRELAARQEETIDTEKAYASFKAHYAPCGDSEDSLYDQPENGMTLVGRHRLHKVLRAVAAAAAVIALGILLSDWLDWKPWAPQPELPEEKVPGSVVSVAIPDADGREVAVGTVTIDRYGIRASIEEKDAQERTYEVSVNYSFYADNTAQANEYWTVIGDTVTATSSESIILQENRGDEFRNLCGAEVTFRELSSGKSVTQSLICVYPVFE